MTCNDYGVAALLFVAVSGCLLWITSLLALERHLTPKAGMQGTDGCVDGSTDFSSGLVLRPKR